MDFSTVLIIAVTTSRIIFPSLPAVSSDAADTSAPAVRSLGIDLFSDVKANPLFKAEVVVPDGLRALGPIRLVMDTKKASRAASEPDSNSRFVVKTYWGCADEIPQGQPRVRMSDEVSAGAPVERLPDASHAYWYSDTAQSLEADASARGTYKLITNYCGATSIVLDADQDFPDPIELIDPPEKTDLGKPIKIAWKPVRRAVAYLVTAAGGSAAESVNWTSSADPDAACGIEDRALTAAEIKKLIEDKVLLPPEAVTCTIPARVFLGSRSVFVNITAFGVDKVQSSDGIQTRVIVRSTAGVPVFGTAYKPPSPRQSHRTVPEPVPVFQKPTLGASRAESSIGK